MSEVRTQKPERNAWAFSLLFQNYFVPSQSLNYKES